MMTSKSVYAVL